MMTSESPQVGYAVKEPDITDQTPNLTNGFQCHESHSEYGHYLKIAHFWVEGVALLTVGLFGVFANILTIAVLKRIDSNMTFNRLLMSLGM